MEAIVANKPLTDASIISCWFIGPVKGPGYVLLASDAPGRSQRWRGESWHRPPGFPWSSMDRKWAASYQPQGTTAMDYDEGWSVLSVADYTEDSRPNVLVAFAVERPDVPESEMREIAERHYPSIWKRLGVKEVK